MKIIVLFNTNQNESTRIDVFEKLQLKTRGIDINFRSEENIRTDTKLLTPDASVGNV